MSQEKKKSTQKKKVSGIKKPIVKKELKGKYHELIKVPGTFEQILKKSIDK